MHSLASTQEPYGATKKIRAVPQPPRTTGKDARMIRPLQEYQDSNPPTLLILFDFRKPDGTECLHHRRSSLQDGSYIEMLSPDHVVLLVGTGGVGRLAS